ncbi:hypothetical protein TPMD03_23 [Thiohalocapsa phage LS06-2018-MD03]|nr:hypothetical protein TPMD03_23 [Thiohalocapsa phage LS06-2018-MD03]
MPIVDVAIVIIIAIANIVFVIEYQKIKNSIGDDTFCERAGMFILSLVILYSDLYLVWRFI